MKKYKYIATEKSPEYRDNEYELENYNEMDFAVFGNIRLKEISTDEIDKIRETLHTIDFEDYFNNIPDNVYTSKKEILSDFFPEYNIPDEKIEVLSEYIVKYIQTYKLNEYHLCKILSILTGKEWDHTTLTGCTQGEYNTMYYPISEWKKEDIERFEIVYWNMGRQWEVESYENDIFTCYTTVDFTCYTTVEDNEKLKTELCNICGCEPEELLIKKFIGYKKIAMYEED